jgi:hypothetical protein
MDLDDISKVRADIRKINSSFCLAIKPITDSNNLQDTEALKEPQVPRPASWRFSRAMGQRSISSTKFSARKPASLAATQFLPRRIQERWI